jgi:hypothetical protein
MQPAYAALGSETSFFLFGMGDRRKLLYARGQLVDLFSREVLFTCRPLHERFQPEDYCVHITTDAGENVILCEDQGGIWIRKDRQNIKLAESLINLPDFEAHPYRRELRILHHEILVNILDGKPLPNCLVYSKPWYRDGAMVAMVLKETGNIRLIADWILSLGSPYDQNNAGICEPDNLGQVLFLMSLTTGCNHPLLPSVVEEWLHWVTPQGYLDGLTDFAHHPIYQTQWLKFGLKALSLPWEPELLRNAFRQRRISLSNRLYDKILKLKLERYPPGMKDDSYTALCWWEKSGLADHKANLFSSTGDYPYLGWAEAHFNNHPPPEQLSNTHYPITWEANASQADYSKMAVISPELEKTKIACPHTWHAAEMFLYLQNFKRRII